jgi:mannosylfructose-phosphate synthase
MTGGEMKKALMISTHGYFEKEPNFGLVDTGGQIVFVIEVSKALAKHGYKVDILTRQFEDFPAIDPINEDVRIVRIPCGGRDFIPKEYLVKDLPELINGFRAFCQENDLQYEFIDSHYWDAGFVGMKLAEAFGIPHMFTPHSLGIWKQRSMEQAMIKEGKQIDREAIEKEFNYSQRNETEKTIMQTGNRALATTPEQKDIIRDDYGIPEGEIAVIPPGFDEDRYRKLDRAAVEEVIERRKLPRRFVLSVGRIASNKAYDLLVKAMKEVIDQVPDINLVFAIGSANPTETEQRQKQELLDLAGSLGISDKVHMFGHIPLIENFYNAAEIYVMPSVYEPFGMVAIEAMACGTPAVITDKSGLKFFLHDGKDALIVNPLDTSAMAKAIVSLAKDGEFRASIAEQGYKTAYADFTWENIVRKTLDTVKGL